MTVVYHHLIYTNTGGNIASIFVQNINIRALMSVFSPANRNQSEYFNHPVQYSSIDIYAAADTFKSTTAGFWRASECVMRGIWQSTDVPLLLPRRQADGGRHWAGLTYAGSELMRAPCHCCGCCCCCSWKGGSARTPRRCAGSVFDCVSCLCKTLGPCEIQQTASKDLWSPCLINMLPESGVYVELNQENLCPSVLV